MSHVCAQGPQGQFDQKSIAIAPTSKVSAIIFRLTIDVYDSNALSSSYPKSAPRQIGYAERSGSEQGVPVDCVFQ